MAISTDSYVGLPLYLSPLSHAYSLAYLHAVSNDIEGYAFLYIHTYIHHATFRKKQQKANKLELSWHELQQEVKVCLLYTSDAADE